MKWIKLFSLAAVAILCLTVAAPRAQAGVDVSIGVAPECPYGYYDTPPYACAPYGYYGPEWFSGGVFIGAGPWYHGDAHFRGHVDRDFDVNHGYKGSVPKSGEKADWSKHNFKDFKGHDTRDGRGH